MVSKAAHAAFWAEAGPALTAVQTARQDNGTDPVPGEGASETRSQACRALFTAPQPLTPVGRRGLGQGKKEAPAC